MGELLGELACRLLPAQPQSDFFFQDASSFSDFFLIVKVQASKFFWKIMENKNHLEVYHYHHFVLYN